MLPLDEIDPKRISEIRNGTLHGRGCGKTTEKMLRLLNYVSPNNIKKKYVFVGENKQSVKNIAYIFHKWLRSCSLSTKYYPNLIAIEVFFFPPPLTIIEKVNQLFNRNINEDVKPPRENIIFYFRTARHLDRKLLGIDVADIILDLTPLTYHENYQYIEMAEARRRFKIEN